MYSFLLLILLGICFRYCYKVYNIDVSEARTLFESNEQQFIVCGYGHTSMLDTPYYCMAGIKLGNIICLAKSKYKKYYPWFILPYIHFIDKGTTKIKDKRHITLLIEGTRTKQSKLRSGYYYLAQNNDAHIVYFIIDFNNNKIRMSRPITHNINIKESLLPLIELTNNYKKSSFSRYPKKLSDIKLGDI